MNFVSLTPGDQEAVVVLKPSLEIRLRVIDAATGKPISPYQIQIGKAKPGSKDFHWELPIMMLLDDYRTSLEAGKGSYQIKVAAGGYEPTQTRVFRGEEKSVREVIRLKKEAEAAR